MGHKSDKKLIVNGKRADGRELDQMRPIEMQIGLVNRANGSALVKFGDTHAIAAAYGPRELMPRHKQEADRGIIRTRYNMAPFSVDDRKAPGSDRRSTELSKVIRLALHPVVFVQDFPKATVDVYIEILQADGSTRVTGINAASLAMAAAGVPMTDLVTACSAGKIDGKLVSDLNGIEDNFGEADLGYAMIPSKNMVTLLQMDGALTKEELVTLLNMAKESCKKIYEMEMKVLKEKYEKALE
ncbi:MAG: exosome complex exonuclease Rrp41 [Candidatus Aenigmarchaeota archaeon]|nr:exosome complex exonuclease Rrp41 [Candidatus Aenigmarchaeota archaeon]